MITDTSTVDWRNPDYESIMVARLEALDRIRSNPAALPELKAYYRHRPIDFMSDWGMTFDPRNVERGLPGIVPFVLFPRQVEWCEWVLAHWLAQRSGLTEKSRDMGVSYLATGLGCTLCLFNDGMAIGYGSRTEPYVDKAGEPKSLFWKARLFMEHLPEEFRGGWMSWRDAPHMRIVFPETGSVISGEVGDQIGRGDRRGIYFIDEAAHLERPQLVDFALSQTTNCRIDLSSVNGMNNPFAQKRWAARPADEDPPFLFIFDWREDPRKDDEWYAKQVDDLDPVVVAQEIDRDYHASVEGIVIPGKWVRSAIGAREKLGIAPAGRSGLSLDIADEGNDRNAIAVTEGVEVLRTEERSGKGSDIFATVQWAFEQCDELGIGEFDYDADGLGAGARGDARVINDQRKERGQRRIQALGFRGSEAVIDPDKVVEGTFRGDGNDKGRTNRDFFANRKAQGWWALRRRFQKVHRWIVDGVRCDPDEIVSISPRDPGHQSLVAELSQPTFETNGVGKIVIDKQPDGMKSPNRADAVMMRFAPKPRPPANFGGDVVTKLARRAALTGRSSNVSQLASILGRRRRG